MDPVPQKHRAWTTWNYVAYWISDAANVPVYELASSMLAIGLSWCVPLFSEIWTEGGYNCCFRRQALLAIALGHIIIAFVVVLNGTIGARLHISFPVLNRSSFGFWFSYFSVVSRVILSMFWFGIQTFTGVCTPQLARRLSAYPLDQDPSALNRCDLIYRSTYIYKALIKALYTLDVESNLAKPSIPRSEPPS